MTQKRWVYDPQSGGSKIPHDVQQCIHDRIMAHARSTLRPDQADSLRIRFKSRFCYIDYLETVHDREVIMHLCRLRYFNKPDEWSMAFFTYSNETYEPCLFPTGKWMGTPEEALDIVFLTEA
jgi:hypothetical protein